MNNQPNEILLLIFKYITKQQLMCLRQVSKRWKDQIEINIFYREKSMSIEMCILTSDYYHFTKQFDFTGTSNEQPIILDQFQKQHIALLEDRILTRQGYPQIYGTQSKCVGFHKSKSYPIKDFAHVNQRRLAIGMPSYEDYQKEMDKACF